MHVAFITFIVVALSLWLVPDTSIVYSLLGCLWIATLSCLIVRRYAIAQHCMLILLVALFAVLCASNEIIRFSHQQLPEHYWKKPIHITVTIDAVQYDKSFAQSVIATVNKGPLGSFPTRINLARYDRVARFVPGEQCDLVVKLKPIHGYYNPGGRSAERMAFAKGITAQGYVDNKQPVHCITVTPWRVKLHAYRATLRRHIQQHVTDTDIQALVAALAIGEKQLTPDMQRILQKTGTSHLLAISGLHVGLVGMFVYGLLRPLTTLFVFLRWGISARMISLILSLLAVCGYILLTGSAVSSQRAGWMYAIAVCIFIFQQSPIKLLLLLGVMCLMIFIQPSVVLDIGFWLSSGMVFILTVLCGYSLKPARGVWGTFRLQWQLSWVAFPFTLLLLKQGSLISPLANLIAIPVVGFGVVPLLLLFDVITPYSSTLSSWALAAAAWVLKYLWAALSVAKTWPVLLEVAHPNGFRALGLLFAAGLLLLPKGMWGRVLGSYFLLVFLLYSPPAPKPGEAWVTWVDVGQGLSVVIQTAQHALVYDTGPRYDTFDIATLTLIPFLKHAGIRHIDTLMISHADNDHRGGIPTLLSQFEVKRMAVGQPLHDIAFKQETCHRDQTWTWDDVLFEQWNVPGTWETSNNHSCVLRISVGNQSVLLTGDLEKDGERALLERGISLNATVLSAPHHGSKTSSTRAFLDAVAPTLVVIPAGFLNSYHHPHPSVIARYDSMQVKRLDTGQVGSIRVTLSPKDSIELTCYRDKKC